MDTIIMKMIIPNFDAIIFANIYEISCLIIFAGLIVDLLSYGCGYYTFFILCSICSYAFSLGNR